MKKIIAGFLTVMCMFSLTACNTTTQDPTGPIKEEETLETEGENKAKAIINLQMRTPDTLDPILTQRQSVRDSMFALYEPLFNVTENFSLENVLAEDYAFNNNATIMTLKLKTGVLWHNNDKLTSADVVYTVNKIKENAQSSYYKNLETVDRVEPQGTYEVVFYLNRPNAYLPYVLYFPIQHAGIDANERFVGTGPFRYKSDDINGLELAKNNAWHGGESAVNGVKFVYMRTAAMAQDAFSSGKIHAVTKDFIDTENFAIKKSTGKHIYPDGLFEFAGFNATVGIFTDPLVRAAFASALDRGKIAQIFDEAIESGFPIMAGSGEFSPSYELTNYNLDYAKELLFAAGWSDRDGDSIVEKNFGGTEYEANVTLLVADTDSLRGFVAEAIKECMLLAGFNVTVEMVDIATYNQRVYGGLYDVFLGAVYYDAPYDISDLLKTGGSVNYTGYRSDDMDITLENFAATWEEEKSHAAFMQLQSVYMAHQPITGLVFRTSYVLTNKVVTGEIKPYPYSPYANIGKWVIE